MQLTKRLFAILLALALALGNLPWSAVAAEWEEGENLPQTVATPDEPANPADDLTISETLIQTPATNATVVDSGTCGDNLTWTLDDAGTLTISGTGAMRDYTYSSSAPWYSNRNIVKTVVVESGVTTIGSFAFYDCYSLTSITIPDSVTAIGSYAFDSCTSLTSIAIPDSVTTIDACTFFGCTSLTSITIPDSVTTIGSFAFHYCSSLTSVTIGDSVTTIGSCAFYDCDSLTSINIPNSVTSIGGSAFAYCDSLISVTIGDSVTTIGDSAFAYCTSLTGFWVSEENPAYSSDDTGVLFSKDQTILLQAPGGCAIGHYAVPDSVTTIGSCAFYDCDSLASVTIGDSVTTIGSCAFYDCDSLTGITIPDSVTTIGSSAFSDCTSLTSVTIGDSVTTIGDYAFYYCTSLTSITIPDSVKIIGGWAFDCCDSLTDVYYTGTEDQWQQITLGMGNECLINARIHFPEVVANGTCGDNLTWTLDDAGILTISGTGAMEGYLVHGITPWDSRRADIKESVIEDGVTNIGDCAFFGCTSLTRVIIGNSITTIGMGAFKDCTSLTSITIPDGVTTILDHAFNNCTSLTSITIPDSVTTIDDCAFSSCTSLTSITIPDSVTYIGDYVFSGCTILTSIAIPDSVTSIESYAFYNCTNLTSITIPDSVEIIDEYAFRGCDSLTDVYYTGTEDQWQQITLGMENECLINARIHFPEVVANGTCGTNLTWTLDEYGKLIISGTGAMQNYSSSGDAPWYSNRNIIKTVVIEYGVTTIGKYAFDNCTSLTSITIPNSVTTIGNYAFYDCDSLTSITIPDSVTTIGYYAFSSCTSLTSITIPDSVTTIDYDAFYGCSSLTDVYITDLAAWLNLSLGDSYANPLRANSKSKNLYLNGELLTNAVIPEGVESICEYAFYYCASLTSVTIPDSVTTIGSNAFSSCTSLTSITIPDSVTTIGYYAFFNCTSLQYNTYDNAKYLGNAQNPYVALISANTISITSCQIHDDTVVIAHYAFRYCTSLTSITIPDSVTTIGAEAFSYCTSLTSITIPDSVTYIGADAFYDCSDLRYNTYDNAKYLGNAQNPYVALISATSESIISCRIHDDTAVIAGDAFSCCENMTSISIPNGVTTIGSEAFYGCSSLTDVYITDLAAWLNLSLGDSYANPLRANSKSKNLYLNGELLTNAVIPEGVVSIREYAFYYCASLTSITIPDSVTTIGTAAFRGCSKLTSITIPDSVTTISSGAFEDCTSLPNITIPDSVTTIRSYAFSSCTSLTSITIPDSVTTIGVSAFSSCTSLTSITIPDSVTTIGSSAFSSCTSLTSITIPDSVTTIGSAAFYYCASLTDVYYGGTEEQWGNIAIGNYNDCLTNATLHTVEIVASGTCGDNLTWTLDSTGTLTISGTGAMEGYLVHGITPWDSRRADIKESVIEDGVTKIGDCAFFGCTSLTRVIIGNSITTIGMGAFKDCTSLTSITIPDGVTTILDHAFNNCTSLTSITIPDSVTTIDGAAFSSCTSLTSITIPDSVTYIGYAAFENCTSLTDVYYTGTQAQWQQLSVGTGNGYLTNATIHYLWGHQHAIVTHAEKAPTCTAIGWYAYETCETCDYSTYVELSAIGHSHNAVVTAPTCTAEGFTTHTCGNCGDNYTDAKVAALGHSYVNGACSNCGNRLPVAEDAFQIVLESKQAKVGTTVAVEVYVKNNPGFGYLELTPVIPAGLTLVKAENGDLISDFTKGKQYLWIADENVSEDGLLMTFTFAVDESAELGNYQVNFRLQLCADFSETELQPAIVPAVIEVIDFIYGDANNDGKVSGMDIIRLKRYLADLDYETGESSVEIFPGADANGDGKVSGMDIIRLKRYLADLDYETGESTVVLGPQQ